MCWKKTYPSGPNNFSCGMGLAFHTVPPVQATPFEWDGFKLWKLSQRRIRFGVWKIVWRTSPTNTKRMDMVGLIRKLWKPKKVGKGLCYHPQTHTPHDYFSNTHQSAKWDPNPHSLLQFSCPFSWLSIVKPPGYLDFERERETNWATTYTLAFAVALMSSPFFQTRRLPPFTFNAPCCKPPLFLPLSPFFLVPMKRSSRIN